jgi:hypothetical protein
MTTSSPQIIEIKAADDAAIELDHAALEQCRGGNATSSEVPEYLLELGRQLDNERRSIALVGGVHGGTLPRLEPQASYTEVQPAITVRTR